MMKKGIIMSAVIVCFIGFSTLAEVFPITEELKDQAFPRVSGNYVVWQSNQNFNDYHRIYLKNLETGVIKEIASTGLYHNGVAQTVPDIDGSIVVWQQNGNIMGYDIDANNVFDVCVDSKWKSAPAISGNLVVWSDEGQIYGKYLDQENKFPISVNSTSQYKPDISGTWVVWQDERNNSTNGIDIYGKDISDSSSTDPDVEICIASDDQSSPRISGQLVVWQDLRQSINTDVFGRYLDESTDFLICAQTGKQNYPDVCGDTVVWHDTRLGDHRIYYKIATDSGNGTLIETTSPNSYYYEYPAISGNLVVCQHTNLNKNIFGSYIPMPSVITIDSPLAGDEYLADKEMLIQWQSSIMPSGNVKIEYFDNENDVNDVIIDSTANDGEYLWDPIAHIDSNDFIIKISDPVYPSSFAESGVFSVIICDPNLTADLSGDCEVDMEDFAEFAKQWLTDGKD